MKIDGDEEAMNLLNNMKGSVENKIRAVYNLGYQCGYKVGKSDAVQILERSLMDMTAEQTEPQTEVVMPKKCKGCDSASKIIEAYSKGWTDGAEAVKAMPQTDCAWK